MTKSITTENKFGIKLKGIELLNSSLVRQEAMLENQTKFQFNIRIEQRVDGKKKLVFVIIYVTIQSIAPEAEVGSIAVSQVYEIAGFDEKITLLEGDNFNMQEELVEILNSISISTTRGVMFSTFKGTFLHHAVLPIVNPKQLTQNQE